MTYEEKVERALVMRSRDLFGKVEPEVMAALPATQTTMQVPVEGQEAVLVYVLMPNSGIRSNGLLISYHGGGFIKGRQDKDQVFCAEVAEKFGCQVWDVDYALSPEAPFPTAVNESLAVYEYALTHSAELGIDPEKIILIGHSAGGNLVATVCLQADEKAIAMPARAIIEYAPLDLYTDPSTRPQIEGDIPAEVAKTYNAFYSPLDVAQNPLVSPLFAEDVALARFPPTTIITAKNDSLSFAAEDFAMKLAKAGVETTCKRFQNSRHGFTINKSPGWEDSRALIDSVLEPVLG